MNVKSNASNSGSSDKVSSRSLTTPPSTSSKKSKQKEKRMEDLSIEENLKEKLINLNIQKQYSGFHMKEIEEQNIPELNIPQLSATHNREDMNKNDEERRYRSVGNIGITNLNELSAVLDFSSNNNLKGVTRESLRNLSLQMKMDSSNEYNITKGEQTSDVNTLYNQSTILKKEMETKENPSSWFFGNCCTANNNEYFYERQEPVVQGSSSLFNVNNKFIPYNPNSDMLHISNNTIKLSNIYESDVFSNSMQNNLILNNQKNSGQNMNKTMTNNNSLRLQKKRQSCSATTNYCNCI